MTPGALGVVVLLVGSAAPQPFLQQSAADSSSLSRLAHDAQSTFERRRIRRIPRSWGFGAAGCDERVGRICWIHGEGDWTPEPDSPPLRQARDELIAVLDRVGVAIPGDPWVLGQRIRYFAEAGRWTQARALTEECVLEASWWCLALQGFVLHAFDRFTDAETAFELALAEMEPERRETWQALELITDGRARDRLRDAEREGGDADDRWRRRFWTLSDPLFLREGNDRRSEHFSRWVMAHIQERARTPWAFPWSSDLEELTIRYGWERGWERSDAGTSALSASASVVGHMLPHGRQFIPPGEVIEDLFDLPEDGWVLEEETPATAYTPTFAEHVLPGIGQIATLRRGDSIVVLGATLVPPAPRGHEPTANEQQPRDEQERVAWAPPLRPVPPPAVGLFLLDRELELRRSVRLEGRPQGAVMLAVPAGMYLLSLEAWNPAANRAGRIRVGLRSDTVSAGVATVSDLILLDRKGRVPTTVEEAVGSMRQHTDLANGDSIRVAWEIDGVGSAGAGANFKLSLRRKSGGFFSRVGGWIGGSGDETPLRLAWSEVMEPAVGPRFRSVDVDLPELDGGDYVLSLSIVLSGREELVIHRGVRILD